MKIKGRHGLCYTDYSESLFTKSPFWRFQTTYLYHVYYWTLLLFSFLNLLFSSDVLVSHRPSHGSYILVRKGNVLSKIHGVGLILSINLFCFCFFYILKHGCKMSNCLFYEPGSICIGDVSLQTPSQYSVVSFPQRDCYIDALCIRHWLYVSSVSMRSNECYCGHTYCTHTIVN